MLAKDKQAAVKALFEGNDCRVIALKDRSVFTSIYLHLNDARFVEWSIIDEGLKALGLRIDDDVAHLDVNEYALVAV